MSTYNNRIKIAPEEKNKVINDYGLHIYQNIWHYSFNDELQNVHFNLVKESNGEIVLFSRAYNIFAPLLVYTNTDTTNPIKKSNAILYEFDEKDEKPRSVFWFLKTVTFLDFLERRSKKSSNPKKHFPTLESYDKYKSKVNGDFVIENFNKQFFFEHYNKLKLQEHLSGEEVLQNFYKNNQQINLNWLRTAYLTHNKDIVAIAVLVDDHKSLNLENIAAKRDSLSFGVFLCTELVKHCCENNYYSFDAGVSGLYGSYKQKIFLESKEVFKETKKLSRYFQLLKSSFAW